MITTTARRRDAGLLTVAALLAAALFLVPPLLVPDRHGDFPRAFAVFWAAGGPDLPPGLRHLVDDQFRYHLARVLIALALLATLVTLAVRIRRFRWPLGALALAAAVLLIAGVQGAVSPLGTLLPGLSAGPAGIPAQIREQLTNGPMSPALTVLLDEYVRWHVVKAVLTGLLATVLIGLSVPVWRRRRSLTLLTAVPAAAALVVVAANVSTVADPVPPFLLLVQGSW